MYNLKLFVVLLVALAMTTATVLLAIPDLLDHNTDVGKGLTYFVTTIVGVVTLGVWKGFFSHLQATRSIKLQE